LAEGEVKLCKKEANSLLQDLHFMILEKLNFLRRFYDSKLKEVTDDLNDDWARRMKEATEELSETSAHTLRSLQEKLVGQERQLDQLKEAVTAAKRDKEVMHESADQMQQRLKGLERENSSLKGELKTNSEKFDSLQQEVSEQTSRIKVDSDSMIERTRRDMLSRYERELGTVHSQLEELQAQHAAELEKIEGEVAKFKEEVTVDAQARLRALEAKLEERDYKLKGERDRTDELRRQMSALEDQTDTLQQQHNKALSSFEDQVSRLEASLRQEQDKQVKLRLDKTSELDRLSRQLRETSRESDSRVEQLTSIEKENDQLRGRLIELEETLRTQALEYSQTNVQKERELMSLRELLTKSYTGTLDPVRRARELDRETQELTKQVRRGPQGRRELSEFKAS
jgi:DNA repair exonuclease SbcCD ATPase subunit